jgi:hypothetical protein
MIEGSGSGSVSLTNGSRFGPRRPKTYGSYGSGSATLVFKKFSLLSLSIVCCWIVVVFLVVVEVLCYEPAASAGGGQQERQGRGEARLHPPAWGILCKAQGGFIVPERSNRSKSIPTFPYPISCTSRRKNLKWVSEGWSHAMFTNNFFK